MAKRTTRGRKRTTAASAINTSYEDWLRYFEADRLDPAWPPDVFAIVAAFIRRTGLYTDHERLCTPANSPRAGKGPTAAEIGEEWRRLLATGLSDGSPTTPPQVKRWWSEMLTGSKRSLEEAARDPCTRNAAWNLFIAADVASKDMGIVSDPSDSFLLAAEAFLSLNDYSSFCYQVPKEKLAVLGKQHTPQLGCTLRSLSHNLALYVPADIQALWHGPYPTLPMAQTDALNVLILPWPTEASAGDFHLVRTRRGAPYVGANSSSRYFEYDPEKSQSPAAVARRVAAALRKAKAHATKIHMVVLPECALTSDQFEAVEKIVVAEKAILISGVRGRGSHGEPGRNACAIQPAGMTAAAKAILTGRVSFDSLRRVQHKHHPWRLDNGQIVQYGLGGRLPPGLECWERIKIGPRRINFVALQEWLTICTLICEDLARQDPVADVIRAVGPNLVVALLMDGPQLSNRWPARYASVLAEDPGSSVLTVTNLGMAKLSRPRELQRKEDDKSRVIACWRDALSGEQQIELNEGDDACVLNLVCKLRQEFTLDGRVERNSYYPVYAGRTSFCTTG